MYCIGVVIAVIAVRAVRAVVAVIAVIVVIAAAAAVVVERIRFVSANFLGGLGVSDDALR